MKQIDDYIDSIRHEVEILEETKFYGSMVFQLNFTNGHVSHMNVEKKKSVKLDK